jgi:HAD superfamily hydrolase (TIGR01509 family)
MNLPDFTAVIMDMDGLVLDTEETYCLAWQEAANNMGFTLTNDFCRLLSGQPYQQVERLIVNELGKSFKLELFRELSSHFWYKIVSENGIAVKDGFCSLIRVLQRFDIPYSLATNSYFENAVECLEFAGILDYFPNIVARDRVKNAKPAPDIYLQAAKCLEAAIEKTIVVEDSDIGVQAGKSAGAFVVLIPSAAFDGDSSADMMLNNLARLAEMIEHKRTMDSV